MPSASVACAAGFTARPPRVPPGVFWQEQREVAAALQALAQREVVPAGTWSLISGADDVSFSCCYYVRLQFRFQDTVLLSQDIKQSFIIMVP